MRWLPFGSLFSALAGVAAMLCICGDASRVDAGTTGKLIGRVVDTAGVPVSGASVVIVALRVGANTDSDGQYSMLNVAPGVHEVSFRQIGSKILTVRDVVVSSDQTTQLDAVMEQSTLALEEVVVTAARPPVDVTLTSSRVSLTSKQIEALPVQDLEDVVNLQAGVVNGHFRGGRIGEVQYQVDGVTVNNPYNNENTLSLDRSVLQEVQVLSGTFDAEYGQAMSGVVNAVLKDGTDTFVWGAEVYAGAHLFPGNERRLTDDEIRPGAVQNYQLNLSGPTPLPSLTFLLSARRAVTDDYLRAERRFSPSDSSDFENKIFLPTGDGGDEPLGYSNEWSGAFKLSQRTSETIRTTYQAIWNAIEGRRGAYGFRFNPEGLSKQETFALAHGFDLTHTVSEATFYSLNFRQNLFEYQDMAFEDLYDPRYDAAGPPRGDDSYEDGAVVQGVQFQRFEQKTNALIGKASLGSQVGQTHLVKVGLEAIYPNVRFGSPGTLSFATVDGREALVRHVDEPPDFPGVRKYEPIIAAGYAQDQMEWADLTLRVGLRVDYFDPNATIPSDLANPANSISGAPPSRQVAASVKTAVSPRLGVSFPVTDRSGVHFAYGRFTQFPSIGQIFVNADYSVLAQLQAGGISYGVLGNPDVEPENTTQYEFGYKQVVTDDFGFETTLFYKDIRDLLGVEFISTYNGAEYARLKSVDFGNVVGFTVAADHHQIGPVSASIDYTWQLAQGNSSDPRESATRAAAGEDPRPRQVPFNWDQRHTVNLTTSYAQGVHAASAVLRVASGQPYTPVLESGFGQGLDANSGRKPSGMLLDLRAERAMNVRGVGGKLFGRVFNVFDTRFFNQGVFSSTGSPDYSRFPEADRATLRDPSRFQAPRRIEIGVQLNPGS